MNVKEENICRLCLKVADDFKIIDEFTRKIFDDVLLLRVNLDVSEDPIMCKDCANLAVKCFNFKSTSIDTKELVITCANDKKRATFEMKDVYKDGKDVETLDDNFICRFCSNHLSGSDSVSLAALLNNVTFGEMLQQLMSEMDFNIIKNPLICTTCGRDLECYIKFVENCLDVEEKITTYLQSEDAPSSGQVKLSEILRFLHKNILQLDHTQTRAIKQEKDTSEDVDESRSEVYDGEFIKTEEIDIKDEEVTFSEIACETPSDTPMYKLNTLCVLKTQIEETRNASIHHSSLASITPENRKCMCDTIRNYCDKCGMQSNLISSETEKAKPYQTKYKGDFQKKKSQMLSTKNIFNSTRLHKGNLKNDIKSIHKDITKVEMHKCSMCTYQAKYKSRLRNHVLIHKDITEVEMYKCSECTYQARQKSNLKIHALIHRHITEMEMYKCSICTFETKHKGSLKSHMLRHKDITEVKTYKCSICPYETKYKHSVKIHMSIHRDFTEVKMYKCSMCIFVTKSKSSLQIHMSIHKDSTDVEMYKCSMCNFQAKRKSQLKSHVLIHMSSTNPRINKSTTTPTDKRNSHTGTRLYKMGNEKIMKREPV